MYFNMLNKLFKSDFPGYFSVDSFALCLFDGILVIFELAYLS